MNECYWGMKFVNLIIEYQHQRSRNWGTATGNHLIMDASLEDDFRARHSTSSECQMNVNSKASLRSDTRNASQHREVLCLAVCLAWNGEIGIEF